MAITVSYSASMRTRKSTSSSNYKSSAASQEFYENTYNFVGIVNFAGMSLTNKVITKIVLKVTAAQAGYGAGSTKTVYVRKSRYQEASRSGVTGANYVGDALGTFTGSFYGNTTSYTFNATTNSALFAAMAAYFQQGYNTLTLYNPSPSKSSQGNSNNYLQWDSCTMTITYEEGVSVPTVSASSVNLGSSVTISTNRLSTAATHIINYYFGNAIGTIATDVGDSVSWTPPLSLASQIPSGTSALCTITCETYYDGEQTGINTCSLTLNVPASVVPSISSVSYSEAVSGIAAQFGGYVQNRSKLAVSISASGIYGSSISSVKISLNGNVYTGTSFTTAVLATSGSNTMTVTVTDSRGRTTSTTRTFTVLAYSPPSLTLFSAQRCNADGSAVQVDGTHVRVSVKGSATSVSSKNTMSCTIYYKLSSASAWTQATTITPSSYAINTTNLVLPQTYNVLNSFDLEVRVEDYFYYIEQSVSIGTKTVLMDFYHDGSAIAFGKVAETPNAVEFGLPVILSQPLSIAQGGTGASSTASACNALGAVPKSGGTMTGNLTIQGQLYPSLYLQPTYNGTTNRTVFEGSYVGASSFSSWEDSSGNNRRMLEVRTASYEPSLDNAVVLRNVVNGSYYSYRVFHAGMATPVPVANGGTGGSNGKTALNNLGIFYSATLPSTGVDGQICLVPV